MRLGMVRRPEHPPLTRGERRMLQPTLWASEFPRRVSPPERGLLQPSRDAEPMDASTLQPRIEALWERRDTLSAATGGDDRAVVEAALEALDSGRARVAVPDGPGGTGSGWRVNQWLKQA